MTPELFAILSDFQEAFKEFVNNLLLVAGGFLVGYLGGGVVGWAIGKWALRQEKPEALTRLGRPVGGALLAVIVAVIVFAGKGKPSGEGGDGKGSDNTDPNGGKGTPKVDPDPKMDSKVEPPKKEIKPADVTIRVTILGGDDVVNERFYLIDDDRAPKTFEDLKASITDRKAREKGKVMVAVLFPNRNALPRDHQAVTRVARWANDDAGLDVIFPTTK